MDSVLVQLNAKTGPENVGEQFLQTGELKPKRPEEKSAERQDSVPAASPLQQHSGNLPVAITT